MTHDATTTEEIKDKLVYLFCLQYNWFGLNKEIAERDVNIMLDRGVLSIYHENSHKKNTVNLWIDVSPKYKSLFTVERN